MNKIYKELAKKLDDLPNGYPETESGVELRILEKLFSPDEASVALYLKGMPEPVAPIAERLGKTEKAAAEILARMAEKGLVGRFQTTDEPKYMLVPFVIGIYEYQVDHIDKELADLFEEYAPFLFKKIGSVGPSMMRVVPANISITPGLEILRYEDMRGMIEESKSFVVRDCICRKEQDLQNEPCAHTLETCLGFSKREGEFEKYTYAGRVITKEEAIKILDDSENEGLVHATYNIQQGQTFVCNCCSCCCGLLRGLKEFDAPYVITKSNFLAVIDPDICTGCGVCAEERCPVGAMVEDGDVYQVLDERCIGCGLCVPVCPSEAITMENRPEDQRDSPPGNLLRWSLKKAANRGIKFGK